MLALLLMVFAIQSQAVILDGDDLRTLPAHDLPLKVNIAFAIFDLTDVNEKEETVDFDGAVYVFWDDPRQAYDVTELGFTEEDFPPGDYSRPAPRIYQGDFAVKEIFQGWRPHIKFDNGIGDRDMNFMAISVWPDGRMGYADHFHTTVETPMNLRRFPFDNQSLKIYVRPLLYLNRDIELIHSEKVAGTWDDDLGIADWKKLDVEVDEGTHEWQAFGGQTVNISVVILTVNLARRPGHVLLSIMLPLVILVALSWCVFWMDEESISSRVNVSFIGMLSVVAYYFVVLDSVPEIPYLTLTDAFIIATFLILAASVVMNFVVDNLNRSDRKAVGDKVDAVCRWAFPTGYACVTALLALIFFRLE